MAIGRLSLALVALALISFGSLGLFRVAPASAQNCTLTGSTVNCDDGRTGKFAGDSIVWPDGTRSSPTRPESVIIGNSASVHVGPGVLVGKGNGQVPLDDPNGRFKKQCAFLNGVGYCY
jgi:hypothetical protein